jgi:hypothetical protein
MRLDQLSGNRQPQPNVNPVSSRFLPAPETVEDEEDIFGYDSRPGILNLDSYVSLLAGGW